MKRTTSAGRSRAWFRSLCALVLTGLIAVTGPRIAAADYLDPLDIAAQPMASAPQSLLLDITRAGERLVAVGARGHILYSDDRGQSWTQAAVPVRAQLDAVCFVDDKQGWAVGEDAVILHSIDGGESWQKQFDARDADMQGPLLDLLFRNAEEGFAVGVFDKLYHTADGGKTWVDWRDHADNPDEWHFFAMAATDADTLYITSEAGLLFRSLDGGDSFEAIETGHVGSFHGILVRRGEDGQDQLLLSGVGGKLFSSDDGGERWREIRTGTEAGLSGGTWLADGSALVVGADGVLLHVAADLKSAKKYQRDNGLPLSNALQQASGDFVLVGLGGLQALNHLQDR
ncbi:hypothetical protein GCM10011348_33520 [Marinobacterium nitratireducens]|uniref:Photosynthesis system II assembly factor Ycf48/Hcf136-like domain-containing protein n=1 Tax=Marinobacterium nitratireducens TaxID=518897 RepID=A0A918DWR6_9GAMM|nr:YCF48-related protein [Marinobacterium nitratireducens]GGO85305.1 hypothetical protein GCM10011348_33520 [Marinobacterium nitratireducens]